MHSFVSALIAATLATLSYAAPIDLPANLPVNVPSVPVPPANLVPAPLAAVTSSSLGQLSSVEGHVDSVTDTVHLRDATPSVAVVFNDISAKVQPYTEQLTYLVSSNLTVAEVTNIVASIKAPIIEAISELKVLVGLDASVVLASVEGDVELTVPQIATIVGGDLELILAAAGHVIEVVNAEGGDIVADVEDVLVDLGNTVTDLVGIVLPLVDGLAASLIPLLAPVDSVITTLGLAKLTALLGLTL